MTIKITDEMVEAVGQEVYGDNWEPRPDSADHAATATTTTASDPA